MSPARNGASSASRTPRVISRTRLKRLSRLDPARHRWLDASKLLDIGSVARRARLTRETVGAPPLRDKIQRKEIDRENLLGMGHDRGLQAKTIGAPFGMN